MSTIKPGDVMLTKSCRMVRVLASRDDGAVAMRDYRSRVAVRSVDTDRLSYHSEHELTLVQPPATPQEPDTYGPFFDPCDKCVTRTHCAHHDRCLAECVPADLRTSAPPAVWQDIETAPLNTSVLVFIPNAEHDGHGVYRAMHVDMGTGKRWMTTGWHIGRDIVAGERPTHWMPLPSPPTPGGK